MGVCCSSLYVVVYSSCPSCARAGHPAPGECGDGILDRISNSSLDWRFMGNSVSKTRISNSNYLYPLKLVGWALGLFVTGLILFCLGVIVAVYGYLLTDRVAVGVTGGEAAERLAQAGDMFGGLNAMLAGGALLIAAFGLRQANQAIGLQREELIATREELRRSADAQEAAAGLQQQALAGQIDLINVQKRTLVYETLQPLRTRALQGDVAKAVNTLSHMCDEQKDWAGYWARIANGTSDALDRPGMRQIGLEGARVILSFLCDIEALGDLGIMPEQDQLCKVVTRGMAQRLNSVVKPILYALETPSVPLPNSVLESVLEATWPDLIAGA